MGEFETFWQAYPLKVGKLAAQREYQRARKVHGATQADILAGIERYKKGKPAYADWAHARTWLHQGRWMDDYKTPTAQPSKSKTDAYQEWVPYHRRDGQR